MLTAILIRRWRRNQIISACKRRCILQVMRKISSDTTVIWKYVFPGLWIPFMGCGVLATGFQAFREPGWIVFVTLWIAGSGYIIWFARRLKFVSIDENFIYVSQWRKEIQIALEHIEAVKQNFLANPKTVTLTLNQPSEFGTKIVFIPSSLAFAAFRPHPVVEEIETAVHRRRTMPRAVRRSGA